VRAKLRQLFLGESGQAMVEYSLMAHLILGAGVLSLVVITPKLFAAFQNYLNSIYFVLNLPLP
jgi:Flp pilus assembly pilin Flp